MKRPFGFRRKASATAVFILALLIAKASAFSPAVFPSCHGSCTLFISPALHASVSKETTASPAEDDDDEDRTLSLRVAASAGITLKELQVVMESIAAACDQNNRDDESENFISFVEDISDVVSTEKTAVPKSAVGATGRAVLLTVSGVSIDDQKMMDDENEWLLPIKYAIAQSMDKAIFENSGSGGLDQPVLISIRPFHESTKMSSEEDALAALTAIIQEEVEEYELCQPAIIQEEVEEYELCQPLLCEEDSINNADRYLPSAQVEIDGAMVQSIDNATEMHFDTSSVLVFDNLVDDDLRRRLLNVVQGYDEDNSNSENSESPNPQRWARGALMDVPDALDENDDYGCQSESPCYGLRDEAIIDLCYNQHDAIEEFERRLTNLFPEFTVSRLPEAVLGSSVSPLTANAPIHGDSYSWHIDADPLQAPPSPWLDIFGRYPNRSKGKPRMMSVLVYLNSEWPEELGAPTRFLDPPTQQTYEVAPVPGRCVLMDQDCSHTVIAPAEIAGERPRYSLVWKLILHPKSPGQDVTDLSAGRSGWPKPLLIGSAVPSKITR